MKFLNVLKQFHITKETVLLTACAKVVDEIIVLGSKLKGPDGKPTLN